MKISLSNLIDEDKLVWYPSAKGVYTFTVKLVYGMSTTEITFGVDNEAMNCNIWNPPPKIQHFLWKACSDSLPIKQNLTKRISSIDPTCPICGHGEESVKHALLQCSWVP